MSSASTGSILLSGSSNLRWCSLRPERRGPIRVGIIGLGRITQIHHGPNILRSPRFVLDAVCDLDSNVAQHLGAAWGIPAEGVATDARDLLDRDLDAVVITNHHHAPVVVAALERGLHVFVEKPLLWSLEEARAVSAAAAAAPGRVLFVGYTRRHDSAFQVLTESIDRGAVRMVRASQFAGGRHRLSPSLSLVKPSTKAPEGITLRESATVTLPDADNCEIELFCSLLQLGIHGLNALRAMFGPPTAVVARRIGKVGCHALLDFDGVPVSWEYLPDFDSVRSWDERLEVVESSRLLSLTFTSPFSPECGSELRVETASTNRDTVVKTVWSVSPFVREIEAFADCIVEGSAAPTGIEDAIADLKLVRDLVTATR
ncbi:Gfo/Idh/MocA family oxidoreductase [Microbacterium sp. A8/3-1]|uniref:Gfo/Idh/MocA family oxidoreductase n=1 Tax=Microbacterium sp. A8/3-1 TaxID=3160749 RepID=A0AAU7W0F5_9MICO